MQRALLGFDDVTHSSTTVAELLTMQEKMDVQMKMAPRKGT